MKYAIITGGSQGIGKAIAEKFLSEGISVAVSARTKRDLDIVEKEWNEKYPTASVLTYPADLGNQEEVKAFATFVLSHFPQVDILVNNAGAYLPGKIADEPDGQLEKLMTINLYSAYHLTRAVLPGMKQKQTGHIFNMCSVASLKAYPGGGDYSITKYALLGFSDNLRLELIPDNIRVTAICPGAVYTRSWQASGLPEERFMKPEDVANIVWASHQMSAYTDVETIIVRPLKGDI